jgi:hypothetical protein
MQFIENMAVQTLLLNQDRCTKNYNMYYDKTGTQEWQMLPWDLEESLGISSGLGGQPAPDYCILECQQWNSPLYCDWNHTQASAVFHHSMNNLFLFLGLIRGVKGQ